MNVDASIFSDLVMANRGLIRNLIIFFIVGMMIVGAYTGEIGGDVR